MFSLIDGRSNRRDCQRVNLIELARNGSLDVWRLRKMARTPIGGPEINICSGAVRANVARDGDRRVPRVFADCILPLGRLETRKYSLLFVELQE